MSQAPRNPFETDTQPLGRPAEKSGNPWLWVLGIIGGVFLVGAIACCGVMYFAWDSASGVLAEVIVQEYADDPVILDKIGVITESEMAMREAITESSKNEDEAFMIVIVKGEKGRGKIVQRTNQKTGEITVTLVMDDGQKFELEIVDELSDFADELAGLEEMESDLDAIDSTIEQPAVADEEAVDSDAEPVAE